MSRDLVLDVVARKNSRDLTTLADEFDRLARQTDDAGRKMHQTGTFSQFLDTELAKTKVKVKELGEEFERTGKADVFASLKGAQSNVKSLERIKGDLTKALESGAQAAEKGIADTLSQVGPNFSKSFWGAVSSMPPQAQAAVAAGLAGVVAVTAPFLGSAISGAILAGVGAVGIGAAIAGQIRDPAVAGALSDMKDSLLSNLTWATSAFGPVLQRSAKMFSDTFEAMAPELQHAFDQAAPYAQKFFDGVGGFVSELGPGFEHALVEGSKILGRIGEDLPALGRSFSEFFDLISSDSQAASDAIHDLMVAIEATVLMLGVSLKALEDGFMIIEVGIDAVTGNTGDLTAKLYGMTDQLDAGSGAASTMDSTIVTLTSDTNSATTAVDDFDAALKKLFDEHMNADQAAIHLDDSIKNLSDSIAKNGRHWDENTESGRRNRQALLDAIDAAEKKRVADVASGKDAAQAAQEYNKQVDKLLGIAGAAGDAKRDLDRLKGRYEIDVDEIYRTHFISEGTPPPDFRHGLAAGGKVPGYAGGGGVIKVGEMGPEYLSIGAGVGPMYVTPNSAINGTANGGAGQIQTLRVILEWPDGTVIRERLVDLGRGRGYSTVDELLPVSTAR